MPRDDEESSFQHAPPGLRRSGGGPQGVLPDGVAPPGRREGRKQGPQAEVPTPYQGPARPDGSFGMVPLFFLCVGVVQLAGPPESAGALTFALLFTLAGVAGCCAWVQAWLMWRRSWKFEWRLWRRSKGKWWR